LPFSSFMSFSSILGQERPIKFLKALLATGRIPPAMVFCGPEGVGKSLAAKEFAKALNCTGPDDAGIRDTGLGIRDEENSLFSVSLPIPQLSDRIGPPPGNRPPQKLCVGATLPSPLYPLPLLDACGLPPACRSCSQIEKGVHPDVRNVNAVYQALLMDEEAEKQSHIKVDTIREVLMEAQRRPVLSVWKVFILHDAHTMVPQAANAMLKLLEEPPEKTLWILLSAGRETLLPTILSRCQTVEFQPLQAELLHDLLVAKSIPSDEARRLAGISCGSAQKAMRIRALLNRLSELDPLDPVYPFAVSGTLPRELASAREQAGLMLELLLASATAGWRKASSPVAREPFAGAARKLLRYRKFLGQNVTPGLILETAFLECGKLGIGINGEQK
ncbi:MAG: hypothetical protein ABIG11_04330, partial [bacterium]